MITQDPMIPSVETLEAVHRFPAVYVFKAIGEDAADFESGVRAALEGCFGESPCRISARASAGGRHRAITAEVLVNSATAVRTGYERLLAVPGLRLLL